MYYTRRTRESSGSFKAAISHILRKIKKEEGFVNSGMRE